VDDDDKGKVLSQERPGETSHVTKVVSDDGRYRVDCSCGYSYGHFVNPSNARLSAFIHRLGASGD